jgi:hypothetical protein
MTINLGSCLYLFLFRDFSICNAKVRIIVVRVLPKLTETSMVFLFNLSIFPVICDYVMYSIGRQSFKLHFESIVGMIFK